MEKPGKAKLNAWKLASMVGCDGDEVDTSQELLNCLRNVPAEKLVSHDREFFVSFMTDTYLMYSGRPNNKVLGLENGKRNFDSKNLENGAL